MDISLTTSSAVSYRSVRKHGRW